MLVPAPKLRALALRAISNLGYGAADAEVLADYFMDGALRRPGAFGMFRGFAEAAKKAGPKKARIKIVKQSPVSAVVDGGGGNGILAAMRATRLAIAKAKARGIAIAVARRAQSTGALALYAEAAAQTGLVALVTTTNKPQVAPLGVSEPLTGTNPLAFGFPAPAGGRDPIVLDITTAALSHGEIGALARDSRPLPEGIAFAPAGAFTLQASDVIPGGGAIRAFGGRRGAGVNLALQLLVLLSGIDAEIAGTNDVGFLIIAVKPDLLLPAAQYRRTLGAFAKRLKGARPADGEDAARLPFERSAAARRQRMKEGVEVADAIYAFLAEMAAPVAKAKAR